jgi:hypothetical protein
MLGSLHGRSRFPRLIRRKRDGAAVVSANEPEKEGKGVDAWRPFCNPPFSLSDSPVLRHARSAADATAEAGHRVRAAKAGNTRSCAPRSGRGA